MRPHRGWAVDEACQASQRYLDDHLLRCKVFGEATLHGACEAAQADDEPALAMCDLPTRAMKELACGASDFATPPLLRAARRPRELSPRRTWSQHLPTPRR